MMFLDIVEWNIIRGSNCCTDWQDQRKGENEMAMEQGGRLMRMIWFHYSDC